MTQTKPKQISRREFIQGAGLLLALGYIGQDVYENKKYDRNVKEIYHTLDQSVRLIKTDIKYKLGEKDSERKKVSHAYGFVKGDKFYTCNHCVEINEYIQRHPFGYTRLPAETIEAKTTMDGVPLEHIINDTDTDIAILQFPEYFSPPSLPYEFGEPFLGQEIYVIGHPNLTDINIRNGHVSDINGWNGEEHLFGYNIPLIGGDSGTPVIGVDGNDLKIVGVSKMKYHGVLSYGIKMLEFDKVMDNV